MNTLENSVLTNYITTQGPKPYTPGTRAGVRDVVDTRWWAVLSRRYCFRPRPPQTLYSPGSPQTNATECANIYRRPACLVNIDHLKSHKIWVYAGETLNPTRR